MSIKAMQYVFESETTKGSQRLMLLSIADRCDDEGTCYPGINKLAKKCNVQRRQAINLIQSLERLGEIRVAEGQGIKTNGGATNRYYMTGYMKSINLPIDESLFRDVEPKKSRPKKAKLHPVQQVTPRATFDATPVQHFAKVVQPAAPNSKVNTKKEIPRLSPDGESPISEPQKTETLDLEKERNKKIGEMIKAWVDGQKAKRVKPRNEYLIPTNREIMGLLVDQSVTPDDVTRFMSAKAKPTGFYSITWVNNDILGWLSANPAPKPVEVIEPYEPTAEDLEAMHRHNEIIQTLIYDNLPEHLRKAIANEMV